MYLMFNDNEDNEVDFNNSGQAEIDKLINFANTVKDSTLDLLGYDRVSYIKSILEDMGPRYNHRFMNMMLNHRVRDGYSYDIPELRKNVPVYRAEDKIKEHRKNIEEKQKESEAKALEKYKETKEKLGSNHLFTKKKYDEYKNVQDKEKFKDNFGLNNSTAKSIQKKYGLFRINKDGAEQQKENKSDRVQPVDICGKSERGNANSFEAQHLKRNNHSWAAGRRLEGWLEGDRRVQDPNNPKKTILKQNAGKKWSPDEYAAAHDKNVGGKVNKVRKGLFMKGFTANHPITNMRTDNIASSHQYSSKHGMDHK